MSDQLAHTATQRSTLATTLLGAVAIVGLVGVARRPPEAASATLEFDAPPAAVYAVLADADRYAEWVASAKEVWRHDVEWPEPGATFHHTQGVGPLKLRDTTTVISTVPDREIVLEVRARPVVVAITRVELEPLEQGRRTRVTLSERPMAGIVRAIHNPLLHHGLRARNLESLRRLRDIVEDEVVGA